MPTPDYIMYSDGGSRGNPGAAAYGFVVDDKTGTSLLAVGKAIGETTNNVAEYSGVIEGLKALRARIGKVSAKKVHVEARMDSELAVKQMNGIYKIKAENIAPLFIVLWNLKQDFASVTFVHVRREMNKRADALVNEALDAQQGGLSI